MVDKEETPKDKIDKLIAEGELQKQQPATPSSPQLNYTPEGPTNKQGQGARQNPIGRMRDIDAATVEKTDKVIADVPKDQQKPLKDHVVQTVYPGQDNAQMRSDKAEKKDLNASQEYLMNRKGRYLNDKNKTPEQQASERSAKKDINASQEYMTNRKGQYLNEKNSQPKDSTSPGKQSADKSASSRFGNNLNFEKNNQLMKDMRQNGKDITSPPSPGGSSSSPTKSSGPSKDRE